MRGIARPREDRYTQMPDEVRLTNAVKDGGASAPPQPRPEPAKATAGASAQPSAEGEKGGDGAQERIRELNSRYREEESKRKQLESNVQQLQGQLRWLAQHVQQQAQTQQASSTAPQGAAPRTAPEEQNFITALGGDDTAKKLTETIRDMIGFYGRQHGFANEREVLGRVGSMVNQHVRPVHASTKIANTLASMVQEGKIARDDVATVSSRIAQELQRAPAWANTDEGVQALIERTVGAELLAGNISLPAARGRTSPVQPGGLGDPPLPGQTEQQSTMDEIRRKFPSLRNVSDDKMKKYVGASDGMEGRLYGQQNLSAAVRG